MLFYKLKLLILEIFWKYAINDPKIPFPKISEDQLRDFKGVM